ncbi:MAG: ABC transporter permease [Acholeplasmataceae bacterium]
MNNFISNLLNKIKHNYKDIFSSSFFATLMAIMIGMFFGLLVMLIANPSNAMAGFGKLLFGGFTKFGDVLYFATPILMTGLAVGFAFKMGLFNIGASGQYTMGLFFALYVGLMWDLPAGIHWIVAVLAAMIGGMLWGVIPGILKAHLNVNEVITSIMLNYIGVYLVDFLIKNNGTLFISVESRTKYLPESVQSLTLGIPGSNANITFIIAVGIAVLMYIILKKTTFGYELVATGMNKHASEYAGINYKRNTIIAMLISGGLAGLGGAFAILAPSNIAGASMTYEPVGIIAANGFNGIAVALLGNSNPVGIVFSALFISHIQRGGTQTSLFGYKPEIVDVVISIIIYFSAFALLMSHSIGKYLKSRKEKKELKNEISKEGK